MALVAAALATLRKQKKDAVMAPLLAPDAVPLDDAGMAALTWQMLLADSQAIIEYLTAHTEVSVTVNVVPLAATAPPGGGAVVATGTVDGTGTIG